MVGDDEVYKDFKRLLDAEHYKSILIKGLWGVGKTHLWDEYQEEKPKKCLYISLTAVKSLRDFRKEIIASIDVNSGGMQKSKKFIASGRNILKSAIPDSLGNALFDEISEIGINLFYKKNLSNKIICLDDFERSTLSSKDLLSICDEIKRNDSKLVVLMNPSEIGDGKEEQREKFNVYKEKIFDIEYEYSDNSYAIEQVILGFKNDNINFGRVKGILDHKKCYNIRLIQMAHNHFCYLKKIACQYIESNEQEAELFRGCLLATIKHYHEKENKEETPEDKVWREILALDAHFLSYIQMHINNLVENGTFDYASFVSDIQVMKVNLDNNELRESFWAVYRNKIINPTLAKDNLKKHIKNMHNTLDKNILFQVINLAHFKDEVDDKEYKKIKTKWEEKYKNLIANNNAEELAKVIDELNIHKRHFESNEDYEWKYPIAQKTLSDKMTDDEKVKTMFDLANRNISLYDEGGILLRNILYEDMEKIYNGYEENSIEKNDFERNIIKINHFFQLGNSTEGLKDFINAIEKMFEKIKDNIISRHGKKTSKTIEMVDNYIKEVSNK